MRRSMFALGAALLLLGGCGRAAQPTAPKPAATVDPEIRSLRAELAAARAQRDAALARLHAVLQRKPAAVRVVVREPAAATPHSNPPQPATRVFSTLTTSATP